MHKHILGVNLVLQGEKMEGRKELFFTNGLHFQERDWILEAYFFRVCSGPHTNKSCNDMEVQLP
jgi:hypothetical protein